MKIIKLNPANRIQVLSQATEIIKQGGTVVYPTETAYGLGANLLSAGAYQKVLQIKGRPASKALPVVVADPVQAASLVRFSPLAWQLADRHWPGPLTLVLPLSVRPLHRHLPGADLAIRVSSHPVARDLSRLTGLPLTATSANLSGLDVCYNISDLLKQLKKAKLVPDMIIDLGQLPRTEPSTIVRPLSDGYQIIRPGAVKIK